MRRRIFFRAAVCIVLGAMTSVGIAWTFAALPSFGPRPPTRTQPRLCWTHVDNEIYDVALSRSAGVSFYVVMSVPFALQADTRSSDTLVPVALPFYVGLPPDAIGAGISTKAFGWPLRVLRDERRWTDGEARPLDRGMATLRIPGAARWAALPLLPIWPSLLASTAIYGSLWGVLFVRAPLRRHLRRRRGRCPRCGYDLRADFAAGCPECGWNREAKA